MQRTEICRCLAVAAFWSCLAAPAFPQVVSPAEIRNPELRELQQKHLAELKAVAVSITSHQFPYRFYFSRTLDLEEEQQKRHDQRSLIPLLGTFDDDFMAPEELDATRSME